MPDALQSVPARTHDHRCALTTCCAPVQSSQIVRHDLEGIQQVIEILDLADRPQAAHGHADGLSENGGLPDPGVGHTPITVLFLKTLEALVDVPEAANVLTKRYDARVATEN